MNICGLFAVLCLVLVFLSDDKADVRYLLLTATVWAVGSVVVGEIRRVRP